MKINLLSLYESVPEFNTQTLTECDNIQVKQQN
jgi:hypothetical protein